MNTENVVQIYNRLLLSWEEKLNLQENECKQEKKNHFSILIGLAHRLRWLVSCSNRLHPSTPRLEAPLACFHLKAAQSHLAPDTTTPSRAMVLDSSRTQSMCVDLENVPGVTENISSSETSQRKQGSGHDNFLHSSNQKTNIETVREGIFNSAPTPQ